MKAKTICEIEQIKHKHAPFMNDKALKYLNAVDDAEQYPGARVAVDYSHNHVSTFSFIGRGINESSKQSG
jgi:hypothetical protein